MEFGRVCSPWSWGNSVVGVYAELCYVVRGRFAVGVELDSTLFDLTEREIWKDTNEGGN
jgi:hypothetical protein